MTSHTFEALEPKYQTDGEEENVPENAITEKVEKLDTEVGGDGDWSDYEEAKISCASLGESSMAI